MPAQTTASKVRNIIGELSAVLIERREHIEAVVLTLLAGKNAILYGPPGAAKSLLIRSVSDRITGANYFETLLDKQLGKEELFGQFDLPLYDQKGIWQRDIDGMLPTADIVFEDEVGKAGPAVLNTLLTAHNEKLFKNGKDLIKIPLISAFGASNEELEDELAAFSDRFMVRMYVDYIKSPDNFMALLQTAVQAGNAPLPSAVAQHTTVTIEELRKAIAEVKTVGLPQAVAVKIDDMRAKMHGESLVVSDRRWRESVSVLQASAWLADRTEVDEDDLQVLNHVLWQKNDQRAKVDQIVSTFVSQFVADAIRIETAVDEVNKELTKRKGQNAREMSSYAMQANNNLDTAQQDITDLIAKARAKNKATARLEQVADEVKECQIRVMHECLGTPEQVARTAVESNWTTAQASAPTTGGARRTRRL